MEIIKALECCCKKDLLCDSCDECPNLVMGNLCMDQMLRDAFNLINRQQSEIEKFANIGKMYSEVRAEAIKEFAKRLKQKETTAISCERFEGVVSTDDIDKLVKEMISN